MKAKIILASFCCLAFVFTARSQGFIYDQQAGGDNVTAETGFALTNQIVGQSFKPGLSGIDFVFLRFTDYDSNVGSGATVYLNLWSGSISNGTLLGATAPVFMPDGFGQGAYAGRITTNFFFASTISLTPGVTYFFQPVLQSGDKQWTVNGNFTFGYANGSVISGGVNQTGFDLWFREGVIAVPEPSPAWLALLGIGSLLGLGRRRK